MDLKEVKKQVETVPDGYVIEHKSKYGNKVFKFAYENGSWYGTGVDGQKIKENPYMQLELTSEALNKS